MSELELLNSLKDCPFCDCNVMVHDHGDKGEVCISCRACPAEMLVSSLPLAVELWNKRI